ncbi:FAD-binding domain-containing protein [Byssothecium circinans]|uniref:FAD-binding domain-containing protein n=1 Tax=Byssothecium circinans TaxID=147558 RepID=A0A6A5TVN0_9PLEO|nr:FAD-binding domain-containing protein [Byssothecium circinans]
MACEELLQSVLGEKVSLRGSDTYISSVNSYYYRSARQKPACVISPTSSEDVAAAIKVLVQYPDTKFAIRSGGHSPHPEVSNTDHGVTIDLSGLNSIEKSNESDDIYRVGAGTNWGAVYKLLDGVGRSALGSRELKVGVGGLSLGNYADFIANYGTSGGLSFFAPQRGWACDSVVNFEVVLASGEIVQANAKSHPDLFAAMKGSRSNFGIVTRMDIVTHLQGNFWGGAIMYTIDTEDAQLDAFHDLKSGNYDPYAQVELSFLYVGAAQSFFVSNNLWYLQDVESPRAFQRFANIQPQITNTMRKCNSTGFATELWDAQPKDQYAVYVTTTFRLSPTIMKKINTVWHSASQTLSSVPNILSVITYQQCPPIVETSTNALGFAQGSTPNEDLIIFIASLYWASDEDSEMVRTLAKNFMEEIEAAATEEGVLHPFKYVNYAATWQDPLKSYGVASLEKLEHAAHKYDPNGLFQKQALGFKL